MHAGASHSTADLSIRVGISTCLLGENVRYDGGHKRDNFLVGTFGPFVEWVPVCPEVELGLGTPREALRLVATEGDVRFVTVNTRVDHTEAMRKYARRRIAELGKQQLCGYVLKKNSPSCGLERVKVYRDGGGLPAKNGRGVFAAELVEALPWLPVEEEGRLCDPRLRENFVERVFACHRLRRLFGGRWRIGDLVAYHTAHKLQLLAHSPENYRRLGRLVAGAKGTERDTLREAYEQQFMHTLARPATTRRHVNVLQHILGHFKQRLDAPARRELHAIVEDYGRGLVPLVVPITLLAHYARLVDVAYIRGQTYLEPHPKELMLRNHV